MICSASYALFLRTETKGVLPTQGECLYSLIVKLSENAFAETQIMPQ